MKRWKFILRHVVHEPTIRVRLKMDNEANLRPENGDGWLQFYELCITRHPKVPFVRSKEYGVAILHIPNDWAAYMETINGKNSAAYYARKAARRGYVVQEVDRNCYADEIHEIKTSKEERQNRAIPPDYWVKRTSYTVMPNDRYWGVLDKQGKLKAYAWVGYYHEAVVISSLMGHAESLNDGVMYQLLIHIIRHAVQLKQAGQPLKCIVYDTFFGATAGMIMFKQKLGFAPHKVRWLPE